MAEANNQEEARRREAAQREQAQRDQAEREKANRERAQSAKGGSKGELEYSDEEDPRSEEEQLADIEAHNDRAKEMQDEALEEQLSSYDPEKIGHRLYGGMDIVDTRNSRRVFTPPQAQVAFDPNRRAREQIAEENREFRPGMREEAQAYERHKTDHTARAEVIARR